MRTTLLAASSVIALIAVGGIAQAQEAPAVPLTVTSGPSAGVLVFTPDFFASQRPNTAQDMVNRVPGFRVEDGDGGRGFEGAVGNILINGARPASKSDTGSAVLGRTSASQVERIELIRGGAPGIDMQGYPVVVNVILNGGSTRESVLTANALLFDGGQDMYGGSYQFTSRSADRTWGVTLSDGTSNSDSNGVGPSVRRNAAGDILLSEDFFNDYYGGSTSLRGTYAGPLLGGRIDLTGRIGVEDTHSIDRFTSPDSHRESLFDRDKDVGELGATYTRPLTDRFDLETRFIHSFTEFDTTSTLNQEIGGVQDDERLFTSTGKTSETILRSLVRHERSPSLTFEAGGEIAFNMLETDQAFSIGGTPVDLPSASVTVEETRGELFGKSTWRINPRLTLESGLRLEASSISQSGDADLEKTFYFVKPRLLGTWNLDDSSQIRVRFEREVGQLDFLDFAASSTLAEDNVLGGNADLEPEERWISEVSYERRFWNNGVVSLTYRHDEITNVIDRIPLEDNLSAVGNIGSGTLDQLSVNIVVPTDRFGVSGGRLTFRNDWNSTEVTDPTTGETRAISEIRASQPNFGFSQDIPSWNLTWSVNYLPRLAQPTFDPDQTVAWRGTDYWEMAAEYKPTPTLAIRAQLNIWDDFEITRTVYADREPPRPVDFVETRSIDPRTFVSLRLRKTF